MSDEARVEELIEELRAYKDRAVRDERVEALVAELEAKAPLRRGDVVPALLAGSLPLLHRVGDVEAMLGELARSDGKPMLRPGEGSANRRALLASLGEGRCVYFWLGHCAYGYLDPALVWIWAAEAERVGVDGNAAPWDSAGLTTEATLGRNLSREEATERVRRYSLPIRGTTEAPHRRYLAEVLARSFEHPDDYWHGETPTGWYPGWAMAPPRPANGGSEPMPPHHTFEVRRQGEVVLGEQLLGVVVSAAVLARNRPAARSLERLVRENAVWDEGKRLHRVDTNRGRKVLRTASDLVEKYLQEECAT
ncbi:MAG: hypothetical protein U0324_37100 [Polyangiales bacterium]